jgi:hypothetical protein
MRGGVFSVMLTNAFASKHLDASSCLCCFHWEGFLLEGVGLPGCATYPGIGARICQVTRHWLLSYHGF